MDRRMMNSRVSKYRLPVIDTDVSYGGKTAHITIDNTGLITVSYGNFEMPIRVYPDGHVGASFEASSPIWFNIPSGSVVDHIIYDISYTNTGSLTEVLRSRFGRTDSDATVSTNDFNLDKAADTNGSHSYNSTFNNTRDISDYMITIMNNTGGVTVSYRVKLIVDGVRWL